MTPEHRDKQQEALARHFIQIPMEIFFDKELTPTDKIIYGRINTFDEFFESNGRTADILGICEKQVRRSKKHLLDLGYIKLGHNDGRGKSYTANEAKLRDIRRAIADEIKRCPGVEIGQETCDHGVTIWRNEWRTICPDERTICPKKRTICPPEYKEEEKENKKEKLTKEKADGSEPQQFGNPDVNAMLDAWAEATGFDLKNQKMERYAMSGLIKSHGLDATKALVERVKRARRSDDRFAPQIAKPSQLRGKYSKLEALTMWEERQAKDAKALHRANPIRIYQQAQPEPTDDKPDTPEAKVERQRIAQELKAKLFAKLNGGSHD
jgi:hypothetical protein